MKSAITKLIPGLIFIIALATGCNTTAGTVAGVSGGVLGATAIAALIVPYSSVNVTVDVYQDTYPLYSKYEIIEGQIPPDKWRTDPMTLGKPTLLAQGRYSPVNRAESIINYLSHPSLNREKLRSLKEQIEGTASTISETIQIFDSWTDLSDIDRKAASQIREQYRTSSSDKITTTNQFMLEYRRLGKVEPIRHNATVTTTHIDTLIHDHRRALQSAQKILNNTTRIQSEDIEDMEYYFRKFRQTLNDLTNFYDLKVTFAGVEIEKWVIPKLVRDESRENQSSSDAPPVGEQVPNPNTTVNQTSETGNDRTSTNTPQAPALPTSKSQTVLRFQDVSQQSIWRSKEGNGVSINIPLLKSISPQAVSESNEEGEKPEVNVDKLNEILEQANKKTSEIISTVRNLPTTIEGIELPSAPALSPRVGVSQNAGPIVDEATQPLLTLNSFIDTVTDPRNRRNWKRLNYARSFSSSGNHAAVIYMENWAVPVLKSARFDPTQFVVAAAKLYSTALTTFAGVYGLPITNLTDKEDTPLLDPTLNFYTISERHMRGKMMREQVDRELIRLLDVSINRWEIVTEDPPTTSTVNIQKINTLTRELEGRISALETITGRSAKP